MLSITLTAILGLACPAMAQTALDDYIDKPATDYSYSVVQTINRSNYTGYHIDLTSQTWRDPTEIINGTTQWHHPMTITQPDTIVGNTAVIYIHGGSTSSGYNLLEEFAVPYDAVVVDLPVVPNQPLQFAGEGFTRYEDEIISKTFAKYLDGGDSEWPLLLPMVKSAVRAMDATQEYMATKGVQIDNFFIFGASKRGWTTWLTAAVDDRVSAISPEVIDFLNIDESMAHHRQAYEEVTEHMYQGYSLEVRDYVDEGVMARLDTPRGQELLEIVDPYEYRDRLDMPKYLLNSTGDQFFLPDSSQFYFDDLLGQKYLRYMPNTDHGLNNDAYAAAMNFYRATSQGLAQPEFTWELSDHGATITVDTEVAVPQQVLMWQATNSENRDFRKVTFGANWTSQALVDQGDGTYVASVTEPETGATAFMVELTYNVGGFSMTYTTEVSVVEPPMPGDANRDGCVNVTDLGILATHYGQAGTFGWEHGDFSGDDSVDVDDLGILASHYGTCSTNVASVPEPGMISLLLCSLAGLLCWRCRK